MHPPSDCHYWADAQQSYFDAIHPAFPILDEDATIGAFRSGILPSTLICEIHACSLIYREQWRNLVSAGKPRPDIQYIWNLAVSALHDDLSRPSFSTVLSCILDLLGRPTTSIIYNAINMGSLVALTKSLGLNRDPQEWDLQQRQKDLRVRTWWGVYIHDQWFVCIALSCPKSWLTSPT